MLTGALAFLAFQSPLRISSPGLTMAEALADASRQSGVLLSADARTGAEIIALRMDGEPLEWLMDRAAWCTGGAWRPQGSGWLLERTPAQEGALIRQANQETTAHLKSKIEQARAVLPRFLKMAFEGQSDQAEQEMMEMGPDMQQYMMLAMFWPALEQIGLAGLVAAQPGARSVYTMRPNRFQSSLSQEAAAAISETFGSLMQMMAQASAADPNVGAQAEVAEAIQAFKTLRFTPESSRLVLQRMGRQVAVIASTRPTGPGAALVGATGEMPMFLNFSLDGPDAKNENPFSGAFLGPGPQSLIGSDTDLTEFKRQFIDQEPLRAYGGSQLLAAAESQKKPFIAVLPDELMGSPFSFGMSVTGAAAVPAGVEAENMVEAEAAASPQEAEEPAMTSPLFRRLVWKDGAARPVQLGRSIEERFPRSAMRELWRRHVEAGEGHIEAALNVLRFVPPAAWSGGYIGIVQAALPWLQTDAGFQAVAARPAAIQFLASLPAAQRQALSQEAWTRFDPGMAVRIEAVLASATDQMMDTGSGDASTVMGSLPPGAWSLELSAASDGMIMARDANSGQIQMYSPEALGEHLGQFENPAYADQRPYMPDLRSFSNSERRVYRFRASAVRPAGLVQPMFFDGEDDDEEQMMDNRMTVNLEVPDIRRPAASYAGLNRLPAALQVRIEAARKAGRTNGFQEIPPPWPPQTAD